jgi:hypothetical protein
MLKKACAVWKGGIKDGGGTISTERGVLRKEANADKRAADCKVAIEKCDAIAGPAKDSCVSNAKVQYGKS